MTLQGSCYWGIMGMGTTETGKVVPTAPTQLSILFLLYHPYGLNLYLTQPYLILLSRNSANSP